MERETIGKQDAPRWREHGTLTALIHRPFAPGQPTPTEQDMMRVAQEISAMVDASLPILGAADPFKTLTEPLEEKNRAGVSWRDYAAVAVDSARRAAKTGILAAPGERLRSAAKVARVAPRLQALARRNRLRSKGEEVDAIVAARKAKRSAAALRAWKTRRANAKKRARAKR